MMEGYLSSEVAALSADKQLYEALRRVAKDDRISCAAARKVAQELGISLREVGKACNELKLKISSCELGCF